MPKDPAAIAQKWATAMSNAGPAWQAGVQAVTTPPGQAAARAADLWANQVAQSKEKFRTNVSKIGLAEWQSTTIEKGGPRLATGAQAAQGKMQDFLQHFLPFVDGVVRAAPPRGTTEQNIARAVAVMRGISAYKRA